MLVDVDLKNQMPDEEAFSLLVRLMSVYDLQGHFLPEMPRLQMRLVSEVYYSYIRLALLIQFYSFK